MSEKKHGDFELTDEQKREMAQFEAASYVVQAKRIEILRKAARASGVTAESLDKLKSEDGRLFVEIEKNYGGYRQAVCKTKDRKKAVDEHAYLCKPQYMLEGYGCGWVIGEPTEQEYNEIGFMSGSAGTRYYCRICGQQIGEFATMHS